MRYEPTVGLEVHVQLKTRSKMFCACSASYGAPPNTHVCPVCLGYPGAMPVMNEAAVRLTVLAGLMLGCRIGARSKFDRKSYFYPDMPKNYQISQYDEPLCLGGGVEIEAAGGVKTVRLTRIHLEEDVAKNSHFERLSGVDFNRAGVPLMEIVTEPDLSSPEEAFTFLQALRRILLYAGVSDCNLEEGNLRCDVNCSVRPEGQARLGTKTELKNLNTFRGVLHALEYEIARQVRVLEGGGKIAQETRRWDPDRGITETMRTKEEAHDYRYFPEPDLMPVALAEEQVEAWRAELPELPGRRQERFVREYGLPEYDAGVLVAEKAVADYYERAVKAAGHPKAISNWMMTEMLRALAEPERDIRGLPLQPEGLGALVRLVETRAITGTTAKELFAELFAAGGDPEALVRERGLAQVRDAGAIEALVDRAIADNAKSVEDFRKGKTAALKFLVGHVMRLSKGQADAQAVTALLESKLAKGM